MIPESSSVFLQRSPSAGEGRLGTYLCDGKEEGGVCICWVVLLTMASSGENPSLRAAKGPPLQN